MPNQPAPSHAARESSRAMWLHIFAGLAASLIGIGIARFGYTPLVPSLIKAQWFGANQVVFLGAVNLAGYLVGAIVGRPLAARTGNVSMLRAMMALVTISLFACAFPVSVLWFFVWRALSGVAGGVIIVLVAATVLPCVPAHKRGVASGAVFLGVGLGVEASGTIVPLLLEHGLRATWIGLGAVSAALTIGSWFCWPTTDESSLPAAAHRIESVRSVDDGEGSRRRTILLYVVYALLALGVVPPMVFLVDYIVRGWNGGAGQHAGAIYWIIYGIGAIVGPLIYGDLADRIGAHRSVRVLLFVQFIALIGLTFATAPWVFGTATFVAGTFPPGIVPMALAWIREAHPENSEIQNALWSRITTVFAALQALAAYAYSAVFAATRGRYELLFELGAGGVILALAVDFAMSVGDRRAVSAPAARAN